MNLEEEIYVQGGEAGCRILGRHHGFTNDEATATCEFDMIAYAEQLLEFYCEAAGLDMFKLRKKLPSPAFPESQATDQELESEGTMHPVASTILMRALWLARLARPDLAFIVTPQLLRCMSYLCHTTNLTLQGTVSQTDESCVLEVFTDADFASCPYSAKSTSGVCLCCAQLIASISFTGCPRSNPHYVVRG